MERSVLQSGRKASQFCVASTQPKSAAGCAGNCADTGNVLELLCAYSRCNLRIPLIPAVGRPTNPVARNVRAVDAARACAIYEVCGNLQFAGDVVCRDKLEEVCRNAAGAVRWNNLSVCAGAFCSAHPVEERGDLRGGRPGQGEIDALRIVIVPNVVP